MKNGLKERRIASQTYANNQTV